MPLDGRENDNLQLWDSSSGFVGVAGYK